MSVTRWVTGRRPRQPTLPAGWVGPSWLERSHPADPLVNRADRHWTAVGTVASPRRAVVDRSGLVTPRPGRGAIDWWVGAEDRWHFPSRESSVRQHLVGTEPVVETMMRVPGGDVAARAYAVVGGGGGELAIIEVENRSAVPVAVAFALRPYNVDALTPITHVEIRDDRVVADGVDMMLLPRPPSRAAASSLAGGDVAQLVESATAARSARCEAGMAQAVVVYPLAHRASLRIALPLDASSVGALPSPLPTAADAARAWTVQAARGLGVVLPSGRLHDAFEANRRYVLQTFTGHDLIATPSRPEVVNLVDMATITGALDRLGFAAEAAAVLRHATRRPQSSASTSVAVLEALATHWRLSRDRALLDDTLPVVSLAAGRVARAGTSPAALADAAELLRAAGELAAAEQCERRAGTPGPHPPADGGDWERVRSLIDMSGPTFTWADDPDPGWRAEGHSGVAAAAFVRLMRDLLVTEDDAGLTVLRLLPEEWQGEGIEVHDAPTAHGRLSFAVRWHASRPVMLWDLEAADGIGPVEMSAPGLAPGWSTTDRQGETVLLPS